jgi:hypothetical protein
MTSRFACTALFLFATLPAFGQPLIPDSSLTYSGELLEGASPSTVPRDVTLRLFSAASGGVLLCTALPVTTAPPARLRIPLGSDCEARIRSNAEAWVELFVSGSGTLSPRTRVTAVPFAVAAERSGRTVATRGSESVSWNGLFKGATTNTFTGAWTFNTTTGYRAGKLACEVELSSKTAHVCSPLEAVNSDMLGIQVEEGWLMNPVNRGVTVYSTNNPVDECAHHTSNGPGGPGGTGSTLGTVWSRANVPNGAYVSWCAAPFRILCCD